MTANRKKILYIYIYIYAWIQGRVRESIDRYRLYIDTHGEEFPAIQYIYIYILNRKTSSASERKEKVWQKADMSAQRIRWAIKMTAVVWGIFFP